MNASNALLLASSTLTLFGLALTLWRGVTAIRLMLAVLQLHDWAHTQMAYRGHGFYRGPIVIPVDDAKHQELKKGAALRGLRFGATCLFAGVTGIVAWHALY